MQVAIGANGTDFTLHMKDAVLRKADGTTLEVNDIVDKMWVRAEGTVMEDQRRIQVTRLQVLGENAEAYKNSVFFQNGHDRGYLLQVGGPRAARRAK